MNINIVIEGCDRIGKSTLSQFIIDKLNRGNIRHVGFGSKSTNPHDQMFDMKEYNLQLLKTCKKQGYGNNLTVWDRFIYGEWVYGKLRGYDANYLFEDDRFILPGNTFLVIVDVNQSTLISRFEDEIQKVDNVPMFLNRFRDVYLNAQTPNKLILFNDFDERFFENAFNQIINLWGDLILE